jgi:hypothetical protein
MELEVFAMKDKKVNAYMQPFFMRSPAEALRAFEATAKDPKTNVYKHPEDYSLYHVGKYDDETATIEQKSEPQFLMSAEQIPSEIVVTDAEKIREEIREIRLKLEQQEKQEN